MGLFTEDKKIKTHQTKVSKGAERNLTDLANRDVNIPRQGVAEMTELQRMAMERNMAMLPTVDQYYKTAGDVLSATARGEYDPYDSQYYQSLREQGERAKDQAATSARQRAEMGGALYSTPAAATESSAQSNIESMLLRELGSLYESERGKQLGAAQALPQLAASQTDQYSRMSGLSDFERQIEQRRQDAVYNQMLQQVLAPYQYNAAISKALYNPQTYVEGGGLNDFGAAMSMAGPIIGSIASGGMGSIGSMGGTLGAGSFSPSAPGMMR